MSRRLITALVCMAAIPAAADQGFDAQSVAVTVVRTPLQSWSGYGIYLGDGLILTAAHVAGRGLVTKPRVMLDGQPADTVPVKEGSYPDNDLTVLRLAGPTPARLSGRRTQVCSDDPQPGEAVTIATPESVTTSVVITPDVLPPDLRARYAASIKDVYTTGNSGSGVFDPSRGCLLGIMSSKIETQVHQVTNGVDTVKTIGLAKHFVPAADIRNFLHGLVRSP